MAHFNFVISQNAKWGHAGFYIDRHRMTSWFLLQSKIKICVPENIVLQKKALNKFNAPGTGRELERTFSKLVEITQSKSHYAVQGHLRSPISVPIESSYTTSY